MDKQPTLFDTGRTGDALASLVDALAPLQELFEAARKLTAGENDASLVAAKGRRDLAAFPGLSEDDRKTIQNLARIPYAIWRYLAENGPTCRKCLNLALREADVHSDQIAGQIRDLRVKGFQIPKSGKVDCPTHGKQTADRLTSLGVVADSSRLRWQYTPKQIKTMLRHCGGKDAFDGDAGSDLELDHRVPRIRAKKDETPVDPDDAAAVRAEFQPLTRVHNLKKSRACETCVLTGERTPFGPYNIPFWFEGGSAYEDEVGCGGCGWAYPEQWHQAIAVTLSSRTRN